ncbi:MAG: FAD-dependent oxidoreductase [Deltaproteobacteria bacterium]|nr:FAD-dependent oxidoreductase [Deltaproteobacteria bacterium]
MKRSFEAIVVGAGPAGATAALTLARAGVDVALVERGAHPGEKNMFGGVLHRMPALERVFPDFWDRAPLQRHLVKKVLTFMTPGRSLNLEYETESFDRAPYNGYTVFRPHFDRWLAGEAARAGATLLTRCTVEGVVREGGKVAGITVLRGAGELRAPVVIAADGVLSFTAASAGLRRPRFDPGQLGLGVKALLELPKEVIDDRFGLVRDQGASREFVGSSSGVRGGGFLYTNYDSLSAGMVLHLDSLRRSGRTPYDLFNAFLAQPQVAKLVRGARLLEYSAHLIPEGGYRMMPELCGDGILVAGDAAAFCYAKGPNLEGINLAAQSGACAAEAVLEARQAGDWSARRLAGYRRRLEATFVLQDLRTFHRAGELLEIDRLYGDYPELICDFMDRMYRIDGAPKQSLLKMGLAMARKKVGTANLVRDGWTTWSTI